MSTPIRNSEPEVKRATALPWSREVIADDDGGFVARIPELPGCFAAGDSVEGALRTLDGVLHEWLTIAIERGEKVPEPRRLTPEFSGRFSLRVPRSLHQALSERAEREDCSLNQLVTMLLSEAVPADSSRTSPITSSSVESDVSEAIATDAILPGPHRVAALKGIANRLRDRGDISLACVIYAASGAAVTGSEGAEAGAREYGIAGAFARREKRLRLAEALWRKSVEADPTNIRSNSSLGQLLYRQGRNDEAITYLSRASGVDEYARLYLGWARLLQGLNLGDKEEAKIGLNDLVSSLRNWGYQKGDRDARTSWIRHVQRLARLGQPYSDEARHLVEFANKNAHWGPIDPSIIGVYPQDTASDDDIVSDPQMSNWQ